MEIGFGCNAAGVIPTVVGIVLCALVATTWRLFV
jgi:hypothetical protein